LIQTIENNLNAHGVPVVRAMTNTPSLIGQGMTPWVANSHVNQAQLLMVQTIFQSIGLEKQLDSEDKLNAATAISGSGPAYFLYMQACMVEEAVRLGFSRAEAALLVNQTALGTAALAETSELTLTELRKQVTSPGGTTEAGLSALMDGRFHQGMRDCIEKAYMRSKALGEEEISPVKKPERMSQNPHAYWTSLGLTQAEYDAIGSENAPKI
jgi:pyrroline-5-carboxylate reductase